MELNSSPVAERGPPWWSTPLWPGQECVSALIPITREAEGARTGTRTVRRKFFRKQPRFMLTPGGIKGRGRSKKTPSRSQSIQTHVLQQCVFITFLKAPPNSHFTFQLLLTQGYVSGCFPTSGSGRNRCLSSATWVCRRLSGPSLPKKEES